jgi:ATP-dependent 26S proteasome regulatory subunit
VPRTKAGGGFSRRAPADPGAESMGSREMRAELEAMRSHVEAIKDEPLLVAQVVEVRSDRMLVSMGQQVIDINHISGAAVGSRVRLHRQTTQAVDVIDADTEIEDQAVVPTGSIVTVMRCEGGVVEAEVMNVLRSFRSSETFQKGERVVVDPSLTYVVGTLGMPQQTFAHAPTISVAWSDIGGQEHAKAALREALELPFSHPQLFAAYGKKNVAGVLLEGPSGVGKTLIAKAAATAIAKAHGQKSVAAGGFVYVKGPELLNAYIGRTEEAIRRLFSSARDHKKNHGYPAVIFLDECDAILGVRDHTSKLSINATTVPQFLAEMDGLDDRATMLILATNRADMLDPAITREGRIDRRVHVGRPSKDDAAAIAHIHLRNRPLALSANGDGIQSAGDMATYVADSIFDHARIVERLDDTHALMLSNFASGAMIAGIIEQATTAAMMRDIGASAAKASGITTDDIDWSIDQTMTSLAHTNRNEVIAELLAAERKKI